MKVMFTERKTAESSAPMKYGLIVTNTLKKDILIGIFADVGMAKFLVDQYYKNDVIYRIVEITESSNYNNPI